MNEIIILTLATYGMSSLLTEYDGPGDIFLKLRLRFPKSPLRCTVCTSVWVSMLFFAILLNGATFYLTPLAVVGVIILADRL